MRKKENRGRWKGLRARVNSFLEHQGFLIVISACVSVIIGTAVWTGRQETLPPSPTPPVEQGQSAAQLLQQSLQEAATPAPTPAPTLAPFQAPLAHVAVLRAFDDSRLTVSGVTGVYRVHDAVDLAAETGEKVLAMADGVVSDVQEKGVDGVCVVIGHPGGIETAYAGLSLCAALRPGDTVQQGQTIGFAGAGPLDERDGEAHLHLRVTRDGVAIDPLTLWR